MKHKLDMDTWARKVHFNFFKAFDEPYHGACVKIDCTRAYQHAKQNGLSFFFYYLYRSLCAAQQVEPFRMRIQNNEVYVYDHLDAAFTVARDNGTFGYGYLPFRHTLQEFIEDGQREQERVKDASDLTPNSAENAILYSVLPWLDFTSISHARVFSFRGTSPFITFGKVTEHEGKRSMPVSIHVHHALVDGLHVGQYVDCFQELMNAE